MHFDFLICSERSGSNLIAKIMNAHTQVCGPFPSHILRIFTQNLYRYGDIRRDENWDSLLDDLAVYHQSIFAQWKVFELAARHQVKVMLDGQAADELLFGYSHFRRAFLGGLVRNGDLGGAWSETRALRPTLSGTVSLYSRALVDAAIPVGWQRRFRSLRKNRRPPDWLDASRLNASFPGRLARKFSRYRTATELSLELLCGGHLQRLLHWEDRNSMAFSVESRVPFLDYRLAEFVLGLPDRHKLRQGNGQKAGRHINPNCRTQGQPDHHLPAVQLRFPQIGNFDKREQPYPKPEGKRQQVAGNGSCF